MRPHALNRYTFLHRRGVLLFAPEVKNVVILRSQTSDTLKQNEWLLVGHRHCFACALLSLFGIRKISVRFEGGWPLCQLSCAATRSHGTISHSERVDRTKVCVTQQNDVLTLSTRVNLRSATAAESGALEH